MDIKCSYQRLWSLFHQEVLYICVITSASIRDRKKRTIKSITGDFSEGKSETDINAVSFENTTVHYFPLGLGEIFPNLIYIRIIGCGLKEISRGDFKGLVNLDSIQLPLNELSMLPDNLFDDLPRLKNIGFRCNEIELVSSCLIRPTFTYADLRGNKNINSFFCPGEVGSVATIEKLVKAVNKKCKKPLETTGAETHVEKVETETTHEKVDHKTLITRFWTSGKFSDFSIIVGNSKFFAHKIVLSMSSLVYAEMFDAQPDLKEMKIKDISSAAVCDFLRYIYAKQPPDSENALEIFSLASKLLVVGPLITICEKIICKVVLNNSNSYKVFKLGVVYNSDKLKLAAFNQIKCMFPGTNISDDLMNEPENLKKLIEAYELLERFKKH